MSIGGWIKHKAHQAAKATKKAAEAVKAGADDAAIYGPGIEGRDGIDFESNNEENDPPR